MARQRDYRAEYRARVERARERGLTTAQATGHAGRAKQAGIRELVATGRLEARRPAPRAPFRTDVRPDVAQRTGTTTVVQSSSARSIVRELKKAAAAGQSVSIRGTYDTPTGVKTITVGGSKTHRSIETDGPIGKVQIAIGADPSGAGKSIPARDILDALDSDEDFCSDEDFWAWLVDVLADGDDEY